MESTKITLPAPILEQPRILTAPHGPETEPEPGDVPLSHYVWLLRRHIWNILLFVGFCCVGTLVLSFRLTPIYEATATIDVDRQIPATIVGHDTDRATANDADQFLATQVRLMQSDSVLRPVVQRFKLLEHERQQQVAPSALPAGASEAPMVLKKLTVTRAPNTYLLQIRYQSPDPKLAAEVANAIAASYQEHAYQIRMRSAESLSVFMEQQLEGLRSKMERSSTALAQFERDLNIINPEEKTNILSARLLQMNTEYTAAQADRVRKEAAHEGAVGGKLEAVQVSTQGEALKRLKEREEDLQEKFAEISAHYGANHPEYRKAATRLSEVQRQIEEAKTNATRRIDVEYEESKKREAMLKDAVAETKAEFDRINSRSFEYQSLRREAEADKKLYEELVRKIKEAGINAGFQNSAIRIADLARVPYKPVFPNHGLHLALAFLISLSLALGVVAISDILDQTIRDPEQVAREFSTDLLGLLPAVKSWRKRTPLLARPEGEAGVSVVLANGRTNEPLSTYEEAVRTLRNSILLVDFDRNIHSLLVTSALPSEGKSTTAMHIAIAHAEQGNKTLLIDADLRRPSIHRKLSMEANRGLSNVLLGEMDWKDAITKSPEYLHLDVLASGPPSRRAADLIGQTLSQMLEQATREYDLVIVDSPPLLGFAEPLQMATMADGVVIVAQAGQTNRKAVASALATLKRLRANVIGLVLNQVTDTSTTNYYYSGQYKYYATKAS